MRQSRSIEPSDRACSKRLYETALAIELDERRINYARQVKIPARYKGRLLGDYVVDLIVEDLVIVEVKSVAHVLPVFEAQLITTCVSLESASAC